MIEAPVSLMQREREFTRLLELYRDERPRSVLEIGVAQGGSLFYWLRDARSDVPVTVVCVDTFSEYDERALFPLWAPPNVTLHIVEGRSASAQTAARVLDIQESYDWVFIDADHSYEAVLLDWLIYGQRAKTVVFHDIVSDANVHPEIEVSRLWRDLRKQHNCVEIIDDVDAAWGGIGVLWPS